MISKGRILIIDSDGEALDRTTTVLREAGFDTLPSQLCVSEVTQVSLDAPDVIVMDACRRCVAQGRPGADLRNHCGIGNIPVLLLTERSCEADHACAFRAGVQKYLVKPCTTDELVLAVEELVLRQEIGTAT